MIIMYLLLALAPLSTFAQTESDPSSQEDRIVGGDLAYIKNFPFQVSLQYYGRHHCGACIINQDWILTAAQCVKWISSETLQIRAGSSYHESGGSIYTLYNRKAHLKFNKTYLFDNDIAVLRVNPPFTFSNYIKPIALADKEAAPGDIAVVTGWGSLREGGRNSKQLRQVSVPIIDRKICAQYYPRKISPRMICAGYTQGGKDACQGDAGSPLIAGGKLIGLVSGGRGCARPKNPGVYTNIPVFKKWIKDKARG